MKLSHLGTPGASLPLRLPPGPGRMEDGMHGQPGLLLPGHLKLDLKGGKESMGCLPAQVCTVYPYTKTSTIRRSRSRGQGTRTFPERRSWQDI